METCKVPHTDLVVSRLAYGVGMLNSSWRSPQLSAESERAIHAAFDNGITLFDTADIYADGRSESALGQVLRKSPGLRREIVVQSKCGLRVRGGWEPGDPIIPGTLGTDLRREHIVSAANGSLHRLHTDSLDVLLLHAASSLVEPEEVARAFDELKDSGKVLNFGVSSHNALQISLLRKFVRQPLVINQIWLSLAHCSPIAENTSYGCIVDYCRLHEIQVQAYSPLKGGNIFNRPILLNPPPDSSPEIKELAQLLVTVSQRYQTTPAAMMIAWLLRHPIGIVPVIGASNPVHIADSCTAVRVDLGMEDWQTLFAWAERIQ